MKNIIIIDTGSGNLTSLESALKKLGYNPIRQTEPNLNLDDSSNNVAINGIVLPGQGRFGLVMQQLQKSDWIKYLEQAKQMKLPILGICVGMQILFESSEEDPGFAGLAWFDGKVQKIKSPKSPMVGWAKLQGGFADQQYLYFVNSYAVKSSECTVATTEYGERFCASVQRENIVGVQFHPEKSAEIGHNIIARALSGEPI